MSCRKFDRQLPEWIAGKLDPRGSAFMAAHSAGCTKCARLADRERALHLQFSEAPAPASRDLWPDIARAVRTGSAPIKRGSPLLPALGGAMATVGAVAVLLSLHGQPSQMPGSEGASRRVDEQHVARLVTAIQEMPDNELDRFVADTGRERSVQTKLLLGREGN